MIKLTAVIIEVYHCCQLDTKLYPTFFSKLIVYADEIIGDHQYRFGCSRSMTSRIIYIHQILEKKWEFSGMIHQLFIDFKKAYDSIRREVLYNILNEFGISKKLAGIIKTCLNETCSTVNIGINLSDKLESSGMWRHVVVLKLTDVLEVCTAFIIRVMMEAVCTSETSVNFNVTT
jgi:hypothetical protein